MSDRTVYIHTNAKQMLGARVAEHSLKRNSRDPGRFQVRIICAEDWPLLQRHEGQSYLREGRLEVWRNDDLQSFTPLRFAVPALNAYQGRAIVMDPDIFAVGDINELLDTDMQGHALLARRMPAEGRRPLHYASSVMLMDCAKLAHWDLEKDFDKLFDREVDYRDWMWLLKEPEGSIGPLAPEWNDFDHLDASTRLLHNTHRRTQPWKTGLKADFTAHGTTSAKKRAIWVRRLKSWFTGGSSTGYYRPHPDPAQERLFFSLLGECLEQGSIGASVLRQEIERQHLRADAFDKLREATSARLPA